MTLPTDEQILITREFDAPKHLVYKAFTTPELVKRWWTAKRGEMKICEIDLRVGGKWRYVMETPDGIEVGFHGEYREIEPNERIVSTEIFEGMPEGVPEEASVNTATFTEEDGRTTLRSSSSTAPSSSATCTSSPGWRTASRTHSICSRRSRPPAAVSTDGPPAIPRRACLT